MSELRSEFETMDAWGIAMGLDVHECNPSLIRDADAIKRYVLELCDLIKMRRYGETQVVHFGDDPRVAGYSMLQLIETSLISAHFANDTNHAYIDVFSCKYYEPEVVRDFTINFFKAKNASMHVSLRK